MLSNKNSKRQIDKVSSDKAPRQSLMSGPSFPPKMRRREPPFYCRKTQIITAFSVHPLKLFIILHKFFEWSLGACYQATRARGGGFHVSIPHIRIHFVIR